MTWAAIVAMAGALSAFAPAGSADRTDDDALIGLFAYQTTFGSPPRGELVVRRGNEEWGATFGTLRTAFKPDGAAIRFRFPGDAGRFRGRVAGGEMRGFWIRPGISGDPRYPGGASQPFATPLTLARREDGAWTGTVRPLDDPLTLYLKIFRGEDGALLGAFRNPEQNRRGPAMLYRVVRDKDVVRFSAGGTPEAPQYRLEARVLPSRDSLQMEWEDAGRPIELVRRTEAAAADFFPRPPGSLPYLYERPPPDGDGWKTARAQDVGIDEDAVERAVQRIIDGDPAARRPSLIHSFLVARNGKLVVEEYFFGYSRHTPHDLRSAGKTFASVLLGAAMQDGVKIGPESKIYELMSARGPFANPDPRKARITLAHLMTHSAGIACDDNDDGSPGNEGTLQTQRGQPDWWKYTLDLPMAHDPGVRYAYCSANINIVGGALATATGAWLPELFEQKIARPLQFGEWHWNLTPTGDGYLGGGAFLRPRDLLKIGQVYLDGGAWQGGRIVSAEWVRESTRPRILITPGTTGLSAEEFGDYYGEGADALAWHMSPIRSGERTYEAYAATGNGGQILIVVPELAMTAVFTGGNYLQGGIWSRWPGEYLGGHIIPATRRGSAPQGASIRGDSAWAASTGHGSRSAH
jgi:CubicO group peptidase (beta-lactamase class C family)